MALKRKINMVNKFEITKFEITSDYKRDNSDNVSVIKRSKMNFVADSNNIDPEAHSPNCTSKYIKITGDKICDRHDTFNFVETSGPQCSLLHDAKPIEYFNLFFNSSLWTLMVKETNRYAEDLLKLSQVSEQSRMKKWKPVTTLEMKAFVAVLLEMGITRRPTIFSYWAENSRNIPWFKQMFSRNRMQLIVKCFRLVNNQESHDRPGHGKPDPCAKFKPVVEHANKMFKLYYTPHQQLSIDESLVETHSGISQYLPNKRHRRGVKFWMLRDAASNYCTSFYYRSTKSKADKDEIKKMGLGYNVAVKLLKESNYLNKGYHIFADIFFTSTALAKYLYSQNTYLTGIIRRKMKDIPNKIKINAGEVKYFRNGEVLLCEYREKRHMKKPVFLISTQAVAQDIVIVQRKRHGKSTRITKPSIVSAYNNFIGGVDESDKMLCTYLNEHRTLKYWKKIVFNIFARMMLNSYIIYKETAKTEIMSQLEFTSSIITEIEREWMQEKKNRLIEGEKKTYGLLKLPGRNLRQCVVCTSKANGIKRSNLICVRCKKGLHALCFDKHECKNY